MTLVRPAVASVRYSARKRRVLDLTAFFFVWIPLKEECGGELHAADHAQRAGHLRTSPPGTPSNRLRSDAGCNAVFLPLVCWASDGLLRQTRHVKTNEPD